MASGRKPDLKYWECIRRLRAAGLTLAEIGRRLGISRQAVHSTLRFIERAQTGVRSVACGGCGRAIVSPGALSSDRGQALCLDCLAQRPEAPFGQRLKAFRLAAGLTKAELTARCGLSRAAVGRYEGAEILPRTLKALQLAEALGVRPKDLGLKRTPAGWALPGKRVGRPRSRGEGARWTGGKGVTPPDRGP
jgi:transcriptional regulator with XRE-family HTH domain